MPDPGSLPSPLDAADRALGPPGRWAGRRVCVAYSGGLDSTVLLQALWALRERHGYLLSAAHVHHGLQPDADLWAQHCAAQARAGAIDFHCLYVNVAADAGQGLEAAAREARYRALDTLDCDLLALAHQRDDQAETVLLQLLRGAGPAGLAGMGARGVPPTHPLRRPVMRPFLELPRSGLLAWARAAGLVWIEDPSNQDQRIDRNYLRAAVGPALAARFPGWRSALARSAHWAAEAQALLDALAECDLQGFAALPSRNLSGTDYSSAEPRVARDPPGAAAEAAWSTRAAADPACLPGRLGDYLALPEPRQRNLLRHLLARHGAPPPPGARLAEWVRQLAAAPDRQPALRWGRWVLRRWGGRLWLEPCLPVPVGFAWSWPGTAAALCCLPDGGQLRILPARAGPPPEACAAGGATAAVRTQARAADPAATAGSLLLDGAAPDALRHDCGPLELGRCSGALRLQLRPGGPHRELRKLFQEAGVPPWRRQRLPALFAGRQLVAVPGIAIAADWQAPPDAPGWQVLWQDGALHAEAITHGQSGLAVL